jgi:cytochrome P450
MRLYPPVHTLGRVAAHDVDLGAFTLRAGDVVVVSTYLMHRRADFFARPTTFDPSRFAHGEADLPKGVYLPFGAGPRVCIGASFALMEGALVMATLLQRLRFVPAFAGLPEPEMGVTLRPKGELWVRVEKR